MKYASICRKSGKMAMSEKTLLCLLKDDPRFNQYENLVSLKYPQVINRCSTSFIIQKFKLGYVCLLEEVADIDLYFKMC